MKIETKFDIADKIFTFEYGICKGRVSEIKVQKDSISTEVYYRLTFAKHEAIWAWEKRVFATKQELLNSL